MSKKKDDTLSPAEMAALLTGHWYVGHDRVRYCKHCDLPLGSKERGFLHSFCLAEPSEGRGHPSPVTVPLRLHTLAMVDEAGVPEWTQEFENLLDRPSAQARFEDALHAYSLKLFDTFIAKSNGGERLTDIAEHQGVTDEVIRDRMRRTRRLFSWWSAHQRAIRKAREQQEREAREERAA